MQEELESMETELSSLAQDVQRYEERKEKQDEVGPHSVFLSFSQQIMRRRVT